MNTNEPVSLRDYFAGQALAGLAAVKYDDRREDRPTWDDVARWAYGHADAMLKEREREQARRT